MEVENHFTSIFSSISLVVWGCTMVGANSLIPTLQTTTKSVIEKSSTIINYVKLRKHLKANYKPNIN